MLISGEVINLFSIANKDRPDGQKTSCSLKFDPKCIQVSYISSPERARARAEVIIINLIIVTIIIITIIFITIIRIVITTQVFIKIGAGYGG